MTDAEHADIVTKAFEENIRNFLSRDGWASLTTSDELLNIFKYNCFYYTDNELINDGLNQRLTEFAKIYIAGEDGDFDQFKAKLKSYDFSATCGLVWTTNYFAYRCRTCCLSPSMSLCAACFNNGNHVGHDFNKFKSQAGGACDCGNPYVMRDFGYCKHHGPSKLGQQRDPPKNLIMRLQMLMPIYLECLLYACWSLIQNIDMDDSSSRVSGNSSNNSDVLVPVLAFLNELLSCGWVVQKLCASIMVDKILFRKFQMDVKDSEPYYVYESAMKSDPGFKFPENRIGCQKLNHQCLVDAYLFVCVKLRFPENLITFLIGLLTMETYKDVFVHSYLNHYSRMASTILIHAKTVRNGQDASYNMNNRIVHISVQLFSGEVLAIKMVKERDLHYLIVHCLLNMFTTALTRLDTNDNCVINCETPMIQNNVFWPLISDLTNLVTHKSVVDYFLTDTDFMKDWTKLLSLMQFMNFFVLKEGNHIEYETMAFFHAYTMEIEISANSMWNIWYHYRNENDRESVLKLVRLFVLALSEYLTNLGTFKTSLSPHPTRKPLSFHLPLMRNVACFISLGLVYHNLPLAKLLENISISQLIRWFEETCNTLLGCQEVLIGYWVRNGQSVRTSTTYYIHSQFCYALIDMDIFSAQICASVIPSATVIHVLTDPSQLLKGIDFVQSCVIMSDKSDITQNRFDKYSSEKQPLALESWLMNLCWLIDLRNELTLDDINKLRKEVCCELCPEPIKRSDLSHRLPEKTGINIQSSPDVDAILSEVATYTAPTFDEYSGNLQSGLYTFKPELWDTDYDSLFQSLRSVTKRDAVDALAKYREYYRQKENISQANCLWPPYRTPLPLHPQMSKLENLLHCKDLTYILFSCLNMFVWSDTIVSEDSLALVIHLIQRSLSVAEAEEDEDESPEFYRTRFPDNQYKVNNAWSNLRYKVELYSEIGGNFMDIGLTRFKQEYKIVQRESILSLLLKVHSKLYFSRLQAGGKSLLSAKASKLLKINPMSSDLHNDIMETDNRHDLTHKMTAEVVMDNRNNTSNRQGHQLDMKAMSFFKTYPLVYEYYPENLNRSCQTGVGVNWGDGVDFVGHLLDVIASKNDENSKALFELVEIIKSISTDNCDGGRKCSAGQSNSLDVNIGASSPPDAVMDKKQKALDRRRRVIANMALKQKAFASSHQLELLATDPESEAVEQIYECVICQLKSNPHKEKMVLLGILCSAGCLKYMFNLSLKKPEKIFRKVFLQSNLSDLPVLSHGLIIQTCGHVVHQDCFDKYKAQRPAVTRMRRTITCPLCRRDVHHLTPVSVLENLNCFDSSHGSLMTMLSKAYIAPHNAFQNHIIEESITKYQACLISPENQACCLLRSQLELELIICLCAPDQYNTVIRRCIWTEFISYLRTLNANMSSVIKFMDVILGTSFSKDILSEEELNDTSFVHQLLLQSPIDLFLNVIPSVWPNEEWINSVFKSCVILSYVKCLISLVVEFDYIDYKFWSEMNIQDQHFQNHLRMILSRLQSLTFFNKADGGSAVSFSRPTHSLEYVTSKISSGLIPLLRIAAILKLRLWKVNQIPNDFPIQPSPSFDSTKELKHLCSYLNLSFSFSDSLSFLENISELIDECKHSTWYQDLSKLINCLMTDEFLRLLNNWIPSLAQSSSSNSKTIPDLMNIGNEIYPPKLIDLPNSYDDLFNTYHSQKCDNNVKTVGHNFPENGLCLICGKLICLICDTMPQAFNEHTKSCCCGMGLIIDVNTSIIHVLLNNEFSQWGSVYLDFYGEEDLELKRGRPLFINAKRFNLLEQQWLTHSFKHVVKAWRRIT